MTRPITLFTGQWADLPFEEVCRLASGWGYDGLEIACWGDHFEVDRALADPSYVGAKRAQLERHGLSVWAISAHLVGQAVCDHPIDQRHRGVLPARIWGDGDPEGVRRRAATEIADTARAAALLGVGTVIGFTGSSIWHTVAMFPPVPETMVEAGYQDFADRWNPILDVFDQEGVRFAHEVHPSEIAYDYWTTARALEAIGHRPAFGEPARWAGPVGVGVGGGEGLLLFLVEQRLGAGLRRPGVARDARSGARDAGDAVDAGDAGDAGGVVHGVRATGVRHRCLLAAGRVAPAPCSARARGDPRAEGPLAPT